MNWWVLRRRLHVSWLVAVLSGATVFGVYVAQYTSPGSFGSVAWLLTASALIFVALERRYLYLIPVLVVAGMLLGMWRGSVQKSELEGITGLIGHVVTVTGVVTDDIDTDASGVLTIRLRTIHADDEPLQGNIWITSSSQVDIKRGDHIIVEGELDDGFGSFAGAMYQAYVQDIRRPQPGDVARVVRDEFADAVRSAVPEPQASLGIGFLVGQKRALPIDLAEALQVVGLTHIVVASGYNLTILVRLARRLFEKLSKYLSALSAGGMIVGFVAVTGMSPSMSRAGLVAGLSLAAWYYGRRFHPVILLLFAAAVTVMVNPSYAWGDLGWQLSFAAFAGVMILAPLLQRFFFGDQKPHLLRQILGETIAAVIATAPILIGAFGQFSNVAVIANMLVLPLVPLAMLLTFIAGVGALVFPGFAALLGVPASWLLEYMVYVAEQLAQVSWATTDVELSGVGVVLCYVILLLVCIVLWRTTKYNLRDSNIVE